MRQSMFQYSKIFLVSSLLLVSILPIGLNASYSDRYATDFPIDRVESICNDQMQEIASYKKSTRIALQRYTYCSSRVRLDGVQKFISHMQWYKVGHSSQWDAIAVLLSDSRMIDTLMNGWVRTKDTWWNIIAAWDGVNFYNYDGSKNHWYRWNSIIGIVENRWDKNPQTRYSFYVIRVLDGSFDSSIRVDIQRMNITQEEITTFRDGKNFDFIGFGKMLNKAFTNNWLQQWSQDHNNDIRSFEKWVYEDRIY